VIKYKTKKKNLLGVEANRRAKERMWLWRMRKRESKRKSISTKEGQEGDI